MFAASPRPEAMTGRPHRAPALDSAAAGAVIPYDMAARFRITGRPGNLLQDVINVSTDGVFVAVGIGYGFEEDRERPLVAPDEASGFLPSDPIVVGDLKLSQLPLAALVEGFRVNPKFAQWVFGSQVPGGADDDFAGGGTASDPVPADRVFGSVLQRIKPPEELSFLFSVVDSSTGREFQDQPAHNLASLGKSNGERPFRLLAQPFYFAPRSTLRLQVTERSEGVRGTLFIVLYGYRLLGASACPEPILRQLRGPAQCPVESIGNPDARIVPYDLVSTLQLSGRRGNQLEVELPVSGDGGFVATNVGYGLAVEERNVALRAASGATGNTINLGDVPLHVFPATALLDGIRLRPDWLRLALKDNGLLADALPIGTLDSLFERLNRPEDVTFRYALFDTGTGRELQNQRLANVAGLGIADGDRPFKKLARPMIFLPRSTVRIELDEVYGRGKLFIVFQGYQLLDRQRGVA
jgi:hypothetical protein